jgi:hypothetical protein
VFTDEMEAALVTTGLKLIPVLTTPAVDAAFKVEAKL